jgi:predicted DCC family thiol-disulfide oxidoreductase YuxK
MEIPGKKARLLLIISLVTFSCMAFSWLLYIFFARQIFEFIYKGESIEFVEELVRSHRMNRLILSRMVFIFVTIQLITMATIKYRSVLRIIKEFFTAATHPINLAVFRVVLFWILFNSVDVSQIVWFSQIPAELRVAPIGLGWLLDYLPIDETWATVSSRLLLIFSFMGMIGLFTRTSALLTVILGFYVLGLPQFFGKVNHYHYLIWFPAILAASRCGDVFSCDAIFTAWKRADRGIIDPPGSSQAYALPLRFVWLLMGIIYFFPGFWKWWTTGIDWALSDNLKHIMYAKWLEFDDWTPLFRIDQYPLLYKPSAIATIAFEISFIFLIFSPKLRFLAPLGGLVFHVMSKVFMQIFFKGLLMCYVTFFDWNAIFHHLGRWLYKGEIYVLYDGSCKLCRRTIASLRVFDIFGHITYMNALDHEAIRSHGFQWLNATVLMTDMHLIARKKQLTGFSAYRALAARIPILWPAVPFLYLWPIPCIADRIYRYVADSRRCTIIDAPKGGGGEGYGPRLSLRAVATIGILLLCGNIFTGIGRVGSSWPFALFPAFTGSGRSEPKSRSLEIAVLSSTGEILPLTDRMLSQKFSPERLRGLIRPILTIEDDEQRRKRLTALWQLWVQNGLSLQQGDAIRFYKVTLLTTPERRKENPIHRELLFELKL